MDRVLIFKTNQNVTDRCANQMAAIRSFRDLNTYQRALEEAEVIFLLTRSFPKEEKYALTDQIRRSSRAVGALLAEAWARRRYRAAFVNKINAALGEAMETQAWLDHAQRCGYISDEKHAALDTNWQEIGGMLNRMIQRADSFCP
jgi:four helix bundle protein